MTTISEIKESEDDAMFLICLHAISRSVSHAIACLKCMLFCVSIADVGSSLERSERAKRARRERDLFDLLTRDFLDYV